MKKRQRKKNFKKFKPQLDAFLAAQYEATKRAVDKAWSDAVITGFGIIDARDMT